MHLVVVSAETRPPAVRRGSAAVERDRATAVRCLVDAQRRAGAPLTRRSDAGGAPLPTDGWYWSWSHTRGRVAATTAHAAVGLDLEWLGRRPSPALFASATAEELEHLPEVDDPWRLRLWTAKEARLKELGLGLGALSRCRLSAPVRGDARAPDAHAFELELDGSRATVLQSDVGEHSLALSSRSLARLVVVAPAPHAKQSTEREARR